MCGDRLTKAEELASLIPEIIETEQSRIGLLCGERLKIAEILLDKCVIIIKSRDTLLSFEPYCKVIFKEETENGKKL